MLTNCIVSILAIIGGIALVLNYFNIMITTINSLFVGSISITIGIFTFYHTYKNLKKGAVSVYNYKSYFFKSEPKAAFRTLLINCFISVLSIFVGIILLLPKRL